MAFGVNLWGQAVGEAEDTTMGLSTTEDFCGFQFFGYSLSPTPCVPFIWNSGKMTPLKTLGGVNGVANQINSFGAVAGFAENATADPGCTAPQIYQFKPVVWSQGGIQQLPISNGDMEGVAFSINDLGQTVGASGSCAPFNPIFLYNFQPVNALLWQNGKAINLGSLGGVTNNFAHDINNRGQVVGGSDVTGDSTTHAFLWPGPNNKMQDLGAVDDDIFSIALGINDLGQVVGASLETDGMTISAFVRHNGNLVDLNKRIAGRTNLFLETACSINFKGQIIGLAVDPTGAIHAYLATPAF
jgi:probable HAF family extracellular repeat protein